MDKDTYSNIFIPLDSFMENMKELDALRAVYSHVANNPLIDPEDSENKPYDIEILIKNGIVFMVTCWDEFVRQVVTEKKLPKEKLGMMNVRNLRYHFIINL